MIKFFYANTPNIVKVLILFKELNLKYKEAKKIEFKKNKYIILSFNHYNNSILKCYI